MKFIFIQEKKKKKKLPAVLVPHVLVLRKHDKSHEQFYALESGRMLCTYYFWNIYSRSSFNL